MSSFDSKKRSVIFCGDAVDVLRTDATCEPTAIFIDPPDNLGVDYAGAPSDKLTRDNYYNLISDWFFEALCAEPYVVWLSCHHTHLFEIESRCREALHHIGNGFKRPNWDIRLLLWRFTFGQHRHTDCGNGYRPLLRFSRPNFEWFTEQIRIPSKRQTVYSDKRANPAGRVPDDVWEFPRVCGTYHERRAWHPNQHPEALIERILRMSCDLSAPQDQLVVDPCAGTGTTLRVALRLNLPCIVGDISKDYCRRMSGETGVPVFDPLHPS